MPSLCISSGHSAVAFPCPTHFARLFHNRWEIDRKGNCFYPAALRAACDCSSSSYKEERFQWEDSFLQRLEWEGRTRGIPTLPSFQAGCGRQHLRGGLSQPAVPDTCSSHSLESPPSQPCHPARPTRLRTFPQCTWSSTPSLILQ